MIDKNSIAAEIDPAFVNVDVQHSLENTGTPIPANIVDPGELHKRKLGVTAYRRDETRKAALRWAERVIDPQRRSCEAEGTNDDR